MVHRWLIKTKWSTGVPRILGGETYMPPSQFKSV